MPCDNVQAGVWHCQVSVWKGHCGQEPAGAEQGGRRASETAAQTQTVGMNRGGPNGEGLEVERTGLSEGLRWGGRGEATSRLVPSFFCGL